MALQGFPDFQHPLLSRDGVQLFAPYEGIGHYTMMPSRLEIGHNDRGHLDFLLSFVRGSTPFSPPKPHGILSFRLVPRYSPAAGLLHLRTLQRNGALKNATLSAGYLRLLPPQIVLGDLPAELLNMEPLLWNSLDARFTLRLPQEGAVFVQEALQSGESLFAAVAVCEMQGVVPRLPVTVRFDPAELLAVLRKQGDAEGLVPYQSMKAFFQRDLAQLPLQLQGEFDATNQATLFAEAMTDRIRARFGRFVPPFTNSSDLMMALPLAHEVPPGSVTWKLAEAQIVPRPWTFVLHPFEAAQEIVHHDGLAAVTRHVVIPPLPTGVFPVVVAANLPAKLQGVEAIGVTLVAPPQPPERVQAIVETVEFPTGAAASQEAVELYLRFSPAEEPRFHYQTFVIFSDSGGVHHWRGRETSHASGWLLLRPSDFPTTFVPIAASPQLLELAELHGVMRWQNDQVSREVSFRLATEESLITLLLPPGAQEATLHFQLRSLDGEKEIPFGPLPAEGVSLDLFSLAEYGEQQIEIVCNFDDAPPFFALDLVPEDKTETPEAVHLMTFTPDNAQKSWSWFAANPFHCGYRYRPHPSNASSTIPWSEVRPPTEPLHLDVSKLIAGG